MNYATINLIKLFFLLVGQWVFDLSVQKKYTSGCESGYHGE